ncbi:MAG: hypothetical protein GY866_33375 [Proteobacteria bacterium]|nr:hypothetical protein [Pseudomonadota bacterium]
MTLGFQLTDIGENYALEIRQGIAQFHPVAPEKVDLSLTLTGDDLGVPGSLQKGIQSGAVKVNGALEDLMKFFECFDMPKANAEILLTLR